MSSAALVIIGHGSTLNPDSSTPTLSHADAIRRQGLFAEVHCAFWKEEPSMREVFYSVRSEVVYIVPNFISEGYFTRQVLPRELNLDGPVTKRDGKTYLYCDPVGIHPSMTKLLLHRADEVAPGVPRQETTLIIVGHGTSLNENSRKAIEDQVTSIRDGGYGFAQVLDAYMEEAPFVAKWDEVSSSPNVVVVPFFIADALHSYQDIPVLLGIETEPTAAASQTDIFRQNPIALRGKQLYYSSAIGTDSLMSGVILDQVADFDTKHPQPPATGSRPATPLPEAPFTIGQIMVSKSESVWLLHHVDETGDPASLALSTDPLKARELSMLDNAGAFRCLKTAPSLRHGWRMELALEADLRLALECFYPGIIGLWEHSQAGSLRPVPLRETLGRQTGMYRFANGISDEQADTMIGCECDAATKCLRRITWPLTDGRPLNGLSPAKQNLASLPANEVPLLCVEACTHIVSAAREISRANHAAQSQ